MVICLIIDKIMLFEENICEDFFIAVNGNFHDHIDQTRDTEQELQLSCI